MTSPQHAGRHRSRESGAALLLVLFLVTCVGIIAAAAISYAGTSMSASAVYQTHRAKSADAEAAIRTAMQYVKANEASGGSLGEDTGSPCPTNFSYPGSTGTVNVSFCPQADSLIHAGDYRAVLVTLAPTGQGITQTKNTTLTIGGDVFSNSSINVRGMNVPSGRVWAWNDTAGGGNCATGSVTASGGKDCNAHTTYNNVVPKIGMDPGDPSLGHADEWAPAGPPGTVQTPSGCNLQPGIYTSGSALTSACAGTINLAAGEYYLDFPSSDNTWTINGTLQGPTCVNPTDQGVQLVFANNSQLSNSGTISIPCGRRATSSGPRIAMIGLANTISAGSNVTTILRPTSAVDGGGGYFPAAGAFPASNAAYSGSGAYPQDATQARASIAANKKKANLQLGTFAAWSGPALSANAAITSLVVKVAHDESNSNISFTTTPPTLVWGTCAVPLTPAPTRLASEGLYVSNDLSASLSACSFDASTSPTLTWSAKTTSASAVNLDVDGAQIEATWHDPGIPAQSGCVIHAGCDLIHSASPNGHDTFLVERQHLHPTKLVPNHVQEQLQLQHRPSAHHVVTHPRRQPVLHRLTAHRLGCHRIPHRQSPLPSNHWRHQLDRRLRHHRPHNIRSHHHHMGQPTLTVTMGKPASTRPVRHDRQRIASTRDLVLTVTFSVVVGAAIAVEAADMGDRGDVDRLVQGAVPSSREAAVASGGSVESA